MSERDSRTRPVEMRFGRIGGLWAGALAVLAGIVVIVLAILLSALLLGLFAAIAVGVLVRAWLSGRSRERTGPQVIDAEYTVIETHDAREPRPKP
ncbi:MAG: hypothetical protein ACRDU5_19360 [Mycobacterium sp.]